MTAKVWRENEFHLSPGLMGSEWQRAKEHLYELKFSIVWNARDPLAGQNELLSVVRGSVVGHLHHPVT